MIFIKKVMPALLGSIVLTGCGLLNNTSKYSFVDGYYSGKIDGKVGKKYYVVTGGDSIKVYPAGKQGTAADTTKFISMFFPQIKGPTSISNTTFRAKTFDLDFLTILFKFRPRAGGFPSQLNTSFNGAVFTG